MSDRCGLQSSSYDFISSKTIHCGKILQGMYTLKEYFFKEDRMTKVTTGILFSNGLSVLEPEPLIYDGVLFHIEGGEWNPVMRNGSHFNVHSPAPANGGLESSPWQRTPRRQTY